MTGPFQLRLPLTICITSRLAQPVSDNKGLRFFKSAASPTVNVTAPPCPPRTPLTVVEPGMMMITLVPMLATCACTAARAPCPILTIAITAPTPMTMPSMVRPARSRFRLRIRSAVITVRRIKAGMGVLPHDREMRGPPYVLHDLTVLHDQFA